MRPLACLTLVVAASPLALAQGAVHVVDALGGPGVDFTDLSLAVDAAADSDTILVRPGFYGTGFQILGKGLTVIADGPATPTVGPIVIDAVGAGSQVLLRGLQISGQNTFETEDVALRVDSCAGTVQVEDCQVSGATGNSARTSNFAEGGLGIVVADSTLVTVTRCGVTGGSGAFGFTSGPGPDLVFVNGAGGLALRASNSGLFLHDSSFVGGTGGSHAKGDDLLQAGKPGGGGADLTDCSTVAIDCRFQGGVGGDADWSTDGFNTLCNHAGPGGDGLTVGGGALLRQLLDLAGGIGGITGVTPTVLGCTPGAFGSPLVADGTALVDLAGTPRELVSPAPLHAGVLTNIRFEGEAGELAFLLISGSSQLTVLLGLDAVFLVPLTSPFVFAGTLPANGVLNLPVVLPGTPSGTPSEFLPTQASFVDLVEGTVRTSGPSGLVVLNPGF